MVLVMLSDDRAVRVEDVIGQWITRGREDAGITQAELGEQLGKYLGRPWPRQAVSAAEKGRRAFSAAELVAFAAVLGTSVASLLEPPPGTAAITLAEGPPIDVRYLHGMTKHTADDDLAALLRTMAAFRPRLATLVETTEQIDGLFLDAANKAWSAARGRGIDAPDELLRLPPRVRPAEPAGE